MAPAAPDDSLKSRNFVDVAVPLGVRKTFAYSVPESLRHSLFLGARVLVPFGRKLLTGYAVGFGADAPEGPFRVRPIRAVLDSRPLIPEELIAVAMWIGRYYFTPPGPVIAALYPAGSRISGVEEVRLSARAAGWLSGGFLPQGLEPQEERILQAAAREGGRSLGDLAKASGLPRAAPWIEGLVASGWLEVSPALAKPRVRAKTRLGIRADTDLPPGDLTRPQQRLMACLAGSQAPRPLQAVLRLSRCPAAAARSLEARGLVRIEPMVIERLPADLSEVDGRGTLTLTAAQREVVDSLRALLDRREACRCLLHGVTGSGKTEIYLRLMAEILDRGEEVLFLVPEIALTPLLCRLVNSHFPDRVALLHSGMSAGERSDQWNRIRAGGAPVVLGTRSAVFAPLRRLRLVVIDEEQDASYKQDESPCYHAREVAWQRVQLTAGLLLMGSATPSIETYHAAVEGGRIPCFTLRERIMARPLPEVIIVDMSLEFQRHGRSRVISEALERELGERLSRGEQAIILLNRRGYSRSLLCRSCGQSVQCPDCSVSMTYHQEEGRLVCHYCSSETSLPEACSNCGGRYIYYVGVGTEQLEHILRQSFPRARMARVDRDSTRVRGSLRRMLMDFSGGSLDILVGTQMLAKGHDFPNVTLVGVVGADAGLAFPDFRAAERTFQLLTQVAGRAGRGAVPGRVLIQTFYPEHYALVHARKQDYEAFYRKEVEFRSLLGYPPFRRLVQVLVSDRRCERGSAVAGKVAAAIRQSVQSIGLEARVRVLGPAPAPLEKLRGEYRSQMLIKADHEVDIGGILREAFEQLGRSRVTLKNVRVDVDPLSLL